MGAPAIGRPATSAAAVLDHIRPDSDLIVQSDNGEPVTVLDAIEATAGRLERVRVHQALAAHDRPYHAGAFGDRLRHISYFLTPKLLGQCASESLGSHYISSTGGQADFMRGAAYSDGGHSFIVTHATAVNGTISRIQPTLSPGAVVTTHKNLVDKVVTEHGVAELRGRTIRQRGEALITVAAPAFRDELRVAVRRLSTSENGEDPPDRQARSSSHLRSSNARKIRSRWLHQMSAGSLAERWNTGTASSPHDGEPVIVAEGVEAVASNTGIHERFVVMAQQRIFQAAATIRVPVHGHHVGEVIGGRGQAPIVPIDEAHVAGRRTERVPDVRIAVHEGEIPPRAVTVRQPVPGRDRTLVDPPAFRGQPIAEVIGEGGETSLVAVEPFRQRAIDEGPDRPPEVRVVPEGRVQPRIDLDDATALRVRGGHRPFGDHRVRLGKILEEELEAARGVVPDRSIAAGHQAGGKIGSDVPVVGDLPLPDDVKLGREPRARRLQEEARRRRRGMRITHFQPEDLRQCRET